MGCDKVGWKNTGCDKVGLSSNVASYGALIGTRTPLKFWETINLTAKISKITKEKHVLHFRLSRQKHAKTHVDRLKQSRN